MHPLSPSEAFAMTRAHAENPHIRFTDCPDLLAPALEHGDAHMIVLKRGLPAPVGHAFMAAAERMMQARPQLAGFPAGQPVGPLAAKSAFRWVQPLVQAAEQDAAFLRATCVADLFGSRGPASSLTFSPCTELAEAVSDCYAYSARRRNVLVVYALAEKYQMDFYSPNHPAASRIAGRPQIGPGDVVAFKGSMADLPEISQRGTRNPDLALFAFMRTAPGV